MTMRWRKHGIVYCPAGDRPWAAHGAMVPTPMRLADDVIRVFVSCSDREGRARPGYVDVSAMDPRRVIGVGTQPCMDIGRPGTFDENGVVASSVLRAPDGRLFMYYVGFELGTRIRYRLLTGLAASEDGGATFRRLRETPVLDRSPEELYFRCGPYVVAEQGRFRMWYIAGSSWTDVNGKPVPEYEVKYLESPDGMHWPERGRPCFGVSGSDEHGFGRPWVVPRDGGYEMFYSVRRRSLGAYRLGYAVSSDGLAWDRRDAELGLDVTPGGFDGTAVMYSAVFEAAAKTWCFYNGDDFGRQGFGLAELESR
jgi:hypothetical protein